MTAADFLEIKEYLKRILRIEVRSDLSGNQYIVLLLDDEIIDKVGIEFEEE